MPVRLMREDGVLDVIGLAREHHAASRYAHIPFEGERVWQWCHACRQLPEYGVFVYVHDTTVSGYLCVVSEPYIWSVMTIVREVALYITPKHRSMQAVRELVAAAEKWAQDNDAHTFDIGMSSPVKDDDVRRYGKVYEYLGFEWHGESYRKELKG